MPSRPQPIKQIMYSAWYQPRVILILLNGPYKGLLRQWLQKRRLPDNIIPVITKHGMGFATARLAIGEYRHVETV